MATALKKTDVVIVGLDAVGGVTALPLTRAGIEVVAGTTRRPMWSTVGASRMRCQTSGFWVPRVVTK
jgi:choline dehydrogenase-like flavoprotein